METPFSEWQRIIREEYLSTFVARGGSTVKFAVAEKDNLPTVMQGMAETATECGYYVAAVDARYQKIQHVEQLFFAIAGEIDWDELADRWLCIYLGENGIFIESIEQLADIDALAEKNGRLKSTLLAEINRLIEHGLLKDYALCKEFRTAISVLCLGRINPQNFSPSDADEVKRWLVGEKTSVATLKRLQLYNKIGRHNARLLLNSLAYWTHMAGYSGMLLIIDAFTVSDMNVTMDAPIRYSRMAVLDTYEVWRQFIDETDEMSYFMLLVVNGPGLLDENNRKYNLENYAALKMRLVDDVHDRICANPLNALVRLSLEVN